MSAVNSILNSDIYIPREGNNNDGANRLRDCVKSKFNYDVIDDNNINHYQADKASKPHDTYFDWCGGNFDWWC